MYTLSISKTSSKTKLSNFVNGVSEEKFILFVSLLTTGILVYMFIPFMVQNHSAAVARDEWRKKQKTNTLYW